jgi:choline dehydrogenase-like flavoprotein
MSKLDISIRFDSDAIKNMQTARRRFVELLDAAGIGNELLPGTPLDLAPGSSVHYGGTARMHRLSEHGVVDQDNRLHDAPNVLVADTACFTTGAEKNPTLTAMALGARACDRLATRLKSDDA